MRGACERHAAGTSTNAATWLIGKWQSALSASPPPMCSPLAWCLAYASTERLVCTAPFGAPVVPEV